MTNLGVKCGNNKCAVPGIRRVLGINTGVKVCDRCYQSYRSKGVLPEDTFCQSCSVWLKNKSSSGFCGDCWDKMPCSFEGCENFRVRWTIQGFCSGHRSMWYRHGVLKPISRVKREGTLTCPIHGTNHIVESGLNRCSSCRRDRAYQRKYGLSPSEVKDLLDSQGGECAFDCCRIRPVLGDPETFNIDHNHLTGKVRAILCRRHNLIIGQAKESEVELNSAINYLRRFSND